MDLDENLSAHVLTTLPTVVELVFRYLNARDLISCSQVCQEWKRTYIIVKRRRQDPLVIYEHAPETCARKPRDCGNKTKDLIKKFQDILDSSYMEPKFGIVFICNMEPTEVRIIETSLRIGNTCMWNFCISYYRLAALLGISGGQTSMFPREFPQRSPCISALFFPDYIPGVEFHSFKIVEEFPPALNSADVIYNVTKIPRDRRVKCLLIFKASPFYIVRTNLLLDPARQIMNYYMTQEKNKIAMGGTQAGFTHFIHSTRVPQPDDQERYVGVGLAITGDQFEAASVLIQPDITTKDGVLEKLKILKKGIVLRKKTFGLLFTSSRMGKQQYDSPDVESVCFKEIFPDVRLIGMKSHGMFNTREILGTTYLPANEFTELPGNDTFIHNNCSVFVILTWGK